MNAKQRRTAKRRLIAEAKGYGIRVPTWPNMCLIRAQLEAARDKAAREVSA